MTPAQSLRAWAVGAGTPRTQYLGGWCPGAGAAGLRRSASIRPQLWLCHLVTVTRLPLSVQAASLQGVALLSGHHPYLSTVPPLSALLRSGGDSRLPEQSHLSHSSDRLLNAPMHRCDWLCSGDT